MEGSRPKLLYRRLDALFGGLDASRPQKQVVLSFFEEAFRALREDLHLSSAALYFELRDGFERVSSLGDPALATAEALAPSLPALALVFRHRVYIFPDPAGEASLREPGALPPGPAAALVVGRRPDRYLMVFGLADGWSREEVDFTLNTIRAALGSRLVDERVRGSVKEATFIQGSLLPDEPPAFPGHELAVHSVAAEEVGGDFYDFHALDDDLLGFAIGDASGHGLPAALLVRDVVTGLRMGVERELKLTHVFGRLNRVIHRSNLSSRFVSLFYGELETSGNLVYVNAGHPPALLFSGRKVTPLSVGGTVIGPLPEVRFRRGLVSLAPGDILVLCTDGILERRNERGDFFGEDRVRRVVQEHRGADASTVLQALFGAACRFGADRPWEDDASALVIRRTPAA